MFYIVFILNLNSFLAFGLFVFSSCEQKKPKYEFHTAYDGRLLIVFDNQTGTIYSKIITQENRKESDPVIEGRMNSIDEMAKDKKSNTGGLY